MFLINLKDYYPEICQEDELLWVSNEVYKVCCQFEKDKKPHGEMRDDVRKIFLLKMIMP